MVRPRLLLCFCLVTVGITQTIAEDKCKTVLWSRSNLDATKARLAKNESLAPLKALEETAEMWLSRSRVPGGLFSVTTKPRPPSEHFNCSKHCFYSMGTYWWPNNKTASGLPYVRNDGLVNPETFKYDSLPLSQMIFAVANLSLAYYFTGNHSYALGAATYVDTFFFDDLTKMDPDVGLEHAQALPGVTGSDAGRGIGIIDAKDLSYVLDSSCLLSSSLAWGTNRTTGLLAWARRYQTWLKHSKHAADEFAQTNNHGTWFDVQAISLALHLDDNEAAKFYANNSIARVRAQVEIDGRMLKELARTRPMHYTWWNLQAFFELAWMGRAAGIDLFNLSVEARSLKAAVDWILPYATNVQKFPYTELTPFDHGKFFQVFRMAAMVWGQTEYEAAIPHLPGSVKYTTNVLNLLWPQASTSNIMI